MHKTLAPYIVLAIAIATAYAVLIGFVPERIGPSSATPGGIRLIRDDYDRSVYFERSAWWRDNLAPYSQVFIEYPHVATYYFAFPASLSHNLQTYMWVHSALMAIVYVIAVAAWTRLATILHTPNWAVLGLLLPAFLYFSLNRYDILPATLTLLSVLALLRKKPHWALITLILAMGLKWYAVILLPLYLARLHTQKQLRTSHIATCFVTFILTIAPLLYIGGWRDILAPYIWQASRGMNIDSLPQLVSTVLHTTFSIDLVKIIFGLAQLCILIAPGVIILRNAKQGGHITDRMFVGLCGLCILLFTWFTIFYSPQWIIWWLPFALLLVRRPRHILLIGIVDLAHYAQYPIGYALIDNGNDIAFTIINIIKWLLLFAMATFFIRRATQELHDYHNPAHI
jgi:hypothetical protein